MCQLTLYFAALVEMKQLMACQGHKDYARCVLLCPEVCQDHHRNISSLPPECLLSFYPVICPIGYWPGIFLLQPAYFVADNVIQIILRVSKLFYINIFICAFAVIIPLGIQTAFLYKVHYEGNLFLIRI